MAATQTSKLHASLCLLCVNFEATCLDLYSNQLNKGNRLFQIRSVRLLQMQYGYLGRLASVRNSIHSFNLQSVHNSHAQTLNHKLVFSRYSLSIMITCVNARKSLIYYAAVVCDGIWWILDSCLLDGKWGRGVASVCSKSLHLISYGCKAIVPLLLRTWFLKISVSGSWRMLPAVSDPPPMPMATI